MERNWNIIREILLRLEESVTPNTNLNMSSFEKFDEQTVAYNMRYLRDSQCIDALIVESTGGDNLINVAVAKHLLPLGHDLLDSIRNDSVWNQIQERFESRGLDMTVDLVISAGRRIIDAMLD